jgi:predicted SnoaL-like aldol condensation-catalyzing enzyme
MEEKKEFEIPKHIIDFYFNKNNFYPSQIKTKNVKYEFIEQLINKNEVLWSIKNYNGKNYIFEDGLIEYGKENVMIYFKKLKDENICNFIVLCSTEKNQQLYFLLNSMNKFFTID